jgi:hypothetical protein
LAARYVEQRLAGSIFSRKSLRLVDYAGVLEHMRRA